MRSLLEPRLQQAAQRAGAAFAVRFANGRELRLGGAAPEFTLVFRSAAAELRTALFGHIGMLESYFGGELDIEGSLRRAMAAGMSGNYASNNLPVAMRNRWHELRLSNASWDQAKKNARFHYALGTDFYRLWLDDPLMMYTCAY
ncbi:MAG TPA: class I SAM-dependent methyltransferase, partial [Burkholderiales bacterium]|nr:class I SAM-dependent methyltransferase [Burkholderiales bacterium]